MRNSIPISVLLCIAFSISLLAGVQTQVCPTFGGTQCNGGTCDSDMCGCGFRLYGISSDYTGVACEAPLCYNADLDIGVSFYQQYVCTGHGDCVGPNNCRCNNGYTGYRCQHKSEDVFCSTIGSNSSLVCSGRGKCLQPNECSCNKGYEGSNCELFRCYGYLKTDPDVCNGKGKCLDWNVCDCENGNSGMNCELASTIGSSVQRVCFGIPNTNSSSCSSHGSCVGLDTCVCKAGYFGNECQFTYCYSVAQNDTSVCNGRGSCEGKDICNCNSQNSNTLFSGKECELIKCKGMNGEYYYSTDSSNVCSGRGQCHTIGCDCSEGYSGAYCQDFSCFGVSKDSALSCSSHGSCIAPDTCNCFTNSTHGFWMGDDCGICDLSHQGSDCRSTRACDRYDTCNGQGNCSNSICLCDDGFKGEFCDQCEDNRYGWDCSQTCSRQVTCSGHGDCSRDGLFCDCDSSQSLGYWKGANCSICLDGYYGDSCLTNVSSHFGFNALGNEIFFSMSAPSIHLGGVVDCAKLLSPSSYSSVGGASARCVYKNSEHPEMLAIELASSATLKPNNTLDVNVKAFDSQHTPKSLVTLINKGLPTSIPVAEISCQNTLVRYGEGLVLTGRNGISVSRERTLYFEWKLLASISSFSALELIISSASGFGNSVLNISANDLPANNSFSIQLRVNNPDFDLWSLATHMNFTKEDQPTVQSSVKMVEVYVYPQSDPLYVTEFILPMTIPYELVEDGVKLDTSTQTSYTVTWTADPDPASLTLDGTTDDSLLFIDPASTFSSMGDANVVVKGEVTDQNSKIVASTSFTLKFAEVYKPSIKLTTLENGVSFNVSSLYGNVEKSLWECSTPRNHMAKCDPEIDAIFSAATDRNSVHIPKAIYQMYIYDSIVHLSAIIDGKQYRLSKVFSNKEGLRYSITQNNLIFDPSYHFLFGRQERFDFDMLLTDANAVMDHPPTISLKDESGTNLTNILSFDPSYFKFSLDTANIPQYSNFIVFEATYKNGSNSFKRSLYGYVGELSIRNCNFSISEQHFSAPVFADGLYFYNISFNCLESSLKQSVKIVLRNSGADRVVCNKVLLEPCLIVLPELIGITEVYANVTYGTDSYVSHLPVPEILGSSYVGNLRERQSVPSDTLLQELQDMFYDYFTSGKSNADFDIQTQIRKLLFLYYPEKEISFNDY